MHNEFIRKVAEGVQVSSSCSHIDSKFKHWKYYHIILQGCKVSSVWAQPINNKMVGLPLSQQMDPMCTSPVECPVDVQLVYLMSKYLIVQLVTEGYIVHLNSNLASFWHKEYTEICFKLLPWFHHFSSNFLPSFPLPHYLEHKADSSHVQYLAIVWQKVTRNTISLKSTVYNFCLDLDLIW